jgi:hypothetical protein
MGRFQMLFFANGHRIGSRVTVAVGDVGTPERVGPFSERPAVVKVRELRSTTPIARTAKRGKPRRFRLVLFGDSERMRAAL